MYHPFCKHCKFYDAFQECTAVEHGDAYVKAMDECPLSQEKFDRLWEIEKIKQSPDCEGCQHRRWDDYFHWVCGLSTHWDNRCFYEKQNCPYHAQGILKEEK